MPIKLLTSGGGGVNLVPSSNIASDQTMYLPTSGTSGGTVLCTDSSGNVGIGTSSPASRLHVSSGTSATVATVSNSSGSSEWQQNGNDLYITNYNAYGSAILRTNGSERMRIDSAGRVTTPYQPFFQGYISPRFTVANGSSTKVSSNIVITHNVGGHWNNYRFTCPVSGVYEVHSGWMKETSTTLAIHWDVYINGQGGGGFRRIRSWEGNGYYYLSNTWLISLSANDYIEFFAYAGGAGQQIYEDHSSIYIKLVG